MAGLDALSPGQLRLANAIIGYVAYLWMTLWPAGLAAFYPLATIPGLAGGALAAALLR